MLCVPGIDCENYWDQLAPGRPLPDVECPNPACQGCLLRGHGWYQRQLDGELERVRRLRCPRCRATHALLPEDLCAYRDLRLRVLERTLQEQDGNSTIGAPAAAQHRASARHRLPRQVQRTACQFRQIMNLLPATSGDFWDRVRAAMGPGDGKLMRLRHWLWSTYRYFLSGLTGLFRHGRPAGCLRGRSTEFAYCPSG